MTRTGGEYAGRIRKSTGRIDSSKKVLEINETYRHWQQPSGGKDEAHDATASGGGGQGGKSRSKKFRALGSSAPPHWTIFATSS